MSLEEKVRSSSQNKDKCISPPDSARNIENSKKKKLQEIQLQHENHKNTIILGICAMKKKVQSKPMKQILSRLACKEIEIVEMWKYLQDHWTTWPIVDALICFHSEGFPYFNAWNYVKKNKPFLINNLDKQQLLWDRTVVYDILDRIKVPVAKHYYLFKDQHYIDQIQMKNWGKIFPEDELELCAAKLSKPSLSSNESQGNSSPQAKKKIKHSFTLSMESHDFTDQKSETSHELHFKQKDQIHDKEESVSPLLSQLKELKELNKLEEKKSSNQESFNLLKFNQKFSESSLPINVNHNFPNTLRSYIEQRAPHMKKYEIQQVEDHLIIKNGTQVIKFNKPFVEKPFDSENHEICVYYPESMGGGRRKLFRKVKNVSSAYENNENVIRTDGNYIYEDFLPTNAFDIKVYTIGPYYMYAEARRSPTLDGVVSRNQSGKQNRYPVILTPDEKFICHRIVQEFQQEVCGFDLLRANGKSYVCDVNGWSFVKANPKYWDDCSIILKKKIFQKFFPEQEVDQQRHYALTQNQNQFRPPMDNISMKVQELRSIVSIFRHGDRSPKLKLKIKTSDPRFIQFFKDTNKDELKLKDAKNLTKILDITDEIIADFDNIKDSKFKQFSQMKTVLQSGGHFQGFTRKLQLKVIQRQNITLEDNTVESKIKKILIVLKWGGELSWYGYQDSIQLGKKMRTERYDDNDCLSLYSSYRHDLKTYSSDEGRCIKTAAAFLKGFLNIEGQLAPIITSMVNTDKKAQRLLDCTSQQNHSPLADKLHTQLSDMMNSKQLLLTSYLKYVQLDQISDKMLSIIKEIGYPLQKLDQVTYKQNFSQMYEHIKELVKEVQRIYNDKWQQDSLIERASNHQTIEDEEKCEDILLVFNRWNKLQKDFKDKELYNISKVPEIYDTIRHDLRKNTIIFNLIDKKIKEQLKDLAKLLAYFVVPNQYGISDQQRVEFAKNICVPLMQKVLVDLMFWKEKNTEEHYWKYKNQSQADNWRHIRTRLYFSSASHIYSILNIFVLGENRELLEATPAEDIKKIRDLLYMGYLSHIQFRLYENLNMEESNPNRFRLEISVSSEYDKNKKMKEFSLGGEGFTINKIESFIKSFASTSPVHSNSNYKNHQAERDEKRKGSFLN